MLQPKLTVPSYVWYIYWYCIWQIYLGLFPNKEYQNYVADLEALPSLIERDNQLIPNRFKLSLQNTINVKIFFFIGRNIDYALSLEGSLKLKKFPYIPLKLMQQVN